MKMYMSKFKTKESGLQAAENRFSVVKNSICKPVFCFGKKTHSPYFLSVIFFGISVIFLQKK